VIERLARASSERPARMIAIWILAVVASLPAIGMFLGDVLTSDVEITTRTESKRGDELLSKAFPQSRAERQRDISEVVVVRAQRGRIADPAAAERVQALAQELQTAGASTVVEAVGRTPLISRDGDARAVLVGLGSDGEDDVPAVYDVVQRLDDEPGYDAAVTGEWTSDADQSELSTDDLRTGELMFAHVEASPHASPAPARATAGAR
jgi:RND superfamily putative drug exporter